MSSKTKRKLQIISAVLCGSALTVSAQTTEEHSHEVRHHDVYELNDFSVVSTGTRTERLLVDVPIKTEVLGQDLFQAAAVTELGQALELLNGARTESNCQNCGTAEIQLLGLPGNYNQILIDGLPLFTGVASVYGIDQIPTIFVERIEIVKGGGSALYGPGAVAGVINLIPEEPFQTHSHVDTSYRSIGGDSDAYQGQFTASFVSEDNKLKTTIYGLLADQNEYDHDGDGFTELVERDNQTIGTYVWWTPYHDTRLRFNYQYIHEERRGGNRLGKPNEFSQVSEFLETDYHWATIRWDQEVTDDFSFNLSASAVKIDRNSFYGGTGDELINPNDPAIDTTAQTYNGVSGVDGSPAGSDAARAFALFGDALDGTGGGSFNQLGDLSSTSYFFDAQFNYDLGEIGSIGTHNLVFGVQYEEESLTDENINRDGRLVNVLQNSDYDNLGFYIQDEWAINSKLEFLPGIRIDKTNTLDDVVISPRIAVRYTATDELTLRANYSTGFLAPRVFSEDTHVDNLGGQPVDTVNADGLKEESSQTFSFGADYTPDAFDGNLVTSLQTYYTILKDSFFIEEPGGTPTIVDGRIKVERVNTDGTSVFGVEWDMSYRFNERWTANAGLAYTHSRFDEEIEVFTGVFSDRYNKSPDWSGVFQLSYDNPDLVDAFFALKWTGPMEVASNTNSSIENSSDFFVLNLGLSRTFALSNDVDMTLQVGVNNLLDQYQDDLESGAGRDNDYVYGPRYPRSFTVGARFDF